MTKSLILDLIWARCPQIRVANLFFKNLALSLLRYHGQLLSCTILEKANDSILRKLSDERTDRQIDRRARVISYGAVQLTSSVQYKFFSRRTTISFKFKNCRKETQKLKINIFYQFYCLILRRLDIEKIIKSLHKK